MTMVRRFLFVATMLALAAATATAAPAIPKHIYKVDVVSVKVSGKTLLVSATGAVNSGGWTSPELRLRGPHTAEKETAVVDFVAKPPLPGEVVIQALVPISATATFPLQPYGTTQVQVMAETNSVTAPIRSDCPRSKPCR